MLRNCRSRFCRSWTRSADTDNRYLSDGLSEDLINALSNSAQLHVASREVQPSGFAGSDRDIRDIGAQLNVAHVLQGSVRRSGTKLRVTAQLVDVRTGYQLWTERYDREMTVVFDISGRDRRGDRQCAHAGIAARKGAIGAAVDSRSRGLRAVPQGAALLASTLSGHRARGHSMLRAGDRPRSAIRPGLLRLADCYGILRVYGWSRHEENKALAESSVTRAMTLTPDTRRVRFFQGVLYLLLRTAVA